MYFQVDGQAVTVPYRLPGINIMLAGRLMRLQTNFSLVVEFDGDWMGLVKVPPNYATHTEGLCGNYDRNPDNDLTNVTSDGVDVSGDINGATIFGNSYQVEDTENPR